MPTRTIPLGLNGGVLTSDDAGRWPATVDGGYPILFFQASGEVFCVACANQEPCAEPITAADIFYEGAPETCDGCGAEIASAYGDPDNPE